MSACIRVLRSFPAFLGSFDCFWIIWPSSKIAFGFGTITRNSPSGTHLAVPQRLPFVVTCSRPLARALSVAQPSSRVLRLHSLSLCVHTRFGPSPAARFLAFSHLYLLRPYINPQLITYIYRTSPTAARAASPTEQGRAPARAYSVAQCVRFPPSFIPARLSLTRAADMPIKPESPERPLPRADVMTLSPHAVPAEFCKVYRFRLLDNKC